MNKIVWLKKAKCAGTSLETAFMESGLIYYIDSDTKRGDLGAPENKVICIRSGIYQVERPIEESRKNSM